MIIKWDVSPFSGPADVHIRNTKAHGPNAPGPQHAAGWKLFEPRGEGRKDRI